jgi:hypothetical protein
LENNSSDGCELSLIKNITYGFNQNPEIVATLPPSPLDNFCASAKHNSSPNTYSIDIAAKIIDGEQCGGVVPVPILPIIAPVLPAPVKDKPIVKVMMYTTPSCGPRYLPIYGRIDSCKDFCRLMKDDATRNKYNGACSAYKDESGSYEGGTLWEYDECGSIPGSIGGSRINCRSEDFKSQVREMTELFRDCSDDEIVYTKIILPEHMSSRTEPVRTARCPFEGHRNRGYDRLDKLQESGELWGDLYYDPSNPYG